MMQPTRSYSPGASSQGQTFAVHSQPSDNSETGYTWNKHDEGESRDGTVHYFPQELRHQEGTRFERGRNPTRRHHYPQSPMRYQQSPDSFSRPPIPERPYLRGGYLAYQYRRSASPHRHYPHQSEATNDRSEKEGGFLSKHLFPEGAPSPLAPLATPQSPSPSYLSLSNESSERLTDPALKPPRKLLILDLNGTLLFRVGHRPGIGRIAHPRPFMPSFRKFLFCGPTTAWLDVMIWSSAQPQNVHHMVDRCFCEDKEKIVAVWARDTLGLSQREYSQKIQTTKDLVKPWTMLPPHSDDVQETHSARTTLLLDDSPLKARLQPYNHVCLKEYDKSLRARDVVVKTMAVHRKSLGEAARMEVSGAFSGEVRQREGHNQLAAEFDISDGTDAPSKAVAASSDAVASASEFSGTLISATTSNQLGVTGTAKKRKRDEPEPIRELRFDETLLAVIGILDTVKVESNVAGWVRAGGLWAGHPPPSIHLPPPSGADTVASVGGDADGDSPQHATEDGATTHPNADAIPTNDDTDIESSNASSPAPPPESSQLTTTSSAVAAVDAADDNTSDLSADELQTRRRKRLKTGETLDRIETPAAEEQSITVAPPPTAGNEAQPAVFTGQNARPITESDSPSEPMWFDHEPTFRHWVTRGRDALASLGIEEEDGIRSG